MKCQCCLSNINHEVCPNCFWEQNSIEDDNVYCQINGLSLKDYKALYMEALNYEDDFMDIFQQLYIEKRKELGLLTCCCC